MRRTKVTRRPGQRCYEHARAHSAGKEEINFNTAQEETERILEKGEILLNCEWVSPMMVVQGKDDTLGLCVNCEKLNAGTECL